METLVWARKGQAMATHKRSGGPQTNEGKSKSSKNANTHGITTSTPVDGHEAARIQSFKQELIDYYSPQSPLEILQIERIALCRAKLARLYEVEQVRLNLRIEEIERSPEKILEHLNWVSGVDKGMVLDLIRFKRLILPCGLEDAELKKIYLEIDTYVGSFSEDADLVENFPVLVRYLKRVGDGKSQTIWLQLIRTAEQIRAVINRGEYYSQYLSSVLAKIKADESSPDEDPELRELEEHISQTQAELRAAKAERHPNRASEVPIFPHTDVIRRYLSIFSELFRAQQRALELATTFAQTKEQVLRSLTLPSSEADLLMRYQTTLERRLSVAIGELLALQNRPGPKNNAK